MAFGHDPLLFLSTCCISHEISLILHHIQLDMPSIRIKSIGPIKDTGNLTLRIINLFIGKQSTGKSTILKILSHCRRVEKLLCVGKPQNGRGVKYAYTHHYRFINELIRFYRFNPDFFNHESEIIYIGKCSLKQVSSGQPDII